ncbi:isochorismatase family protein [Paenibacillus sp. GSMTC-2017]|uniref:cysteine hydrolase family protein n=1 Tax=Paenibacillus sp. GSMTC-2017 TaxID=2794350 RepID=UPI0018D64296|nr:isochorismatase family protein [Paenibacillus sp. GSMTC-2017]MBH5320352.1 isochorismatase family protein [Paenibacillus sp. GSMTC-2017]
MKIGLLIVDMQINILEDKKQIINVERACEYINHVANLLRSKDHVVIHIQDIEGASEASAESIAIIPEIPVDPKDIRITKEHSNAFWNTELEQILKSNDVGLVIVAGFAAEHCVLFTYNGAIERGFKTVILQNGILSTKADLLDLTYRDRNIISYPVIEFITK